jgi:hypothetical protein
MSSPDESEIVVSKNMSESNTPTRECSDNTETTQTETPTEPEITASEYLENLLSQNGNTILLFSTDTQCANDIWTNNARTLISEATGVPVTNIQIGATHTHSGPVIGGTRPLILQWKNIYMDGLLKAAQAAIADRAPATLYGKKVQTENMTFVRHYEMADGTYAGSNFGDFSKQIVGHATEADEQMVLIKMEREGDKKDILLMNFQGHPCFTSSSKKTNLSSDYIGATRIAVEKATDMHFIYFLGSTGNQNTTSKIAEEMRPHNKNYWLYGDTLAQYAIDALPSMTPIQGSGVTTARKIITYASNRYGQDRYADAKKVYDIFRETGNPSSCTAYAKTLGFHSVYECSGIVACHGYPSQGTVELNVCQFGGIGFVAAPYEMFSNSGMYIKENSPFEFTVISTVTNASNKYFPTKEAYAYGCYESFTARFASGIAEYTADQFLQMLREIQ